MTTKGPAIEISIDNSTVHGDVVAGDKHVHVHLHHEQLQSVGAIYAALAQQVNQTTAADNLVRDILDSPELLARLDAARKEQNQKTAERRLDAVLRDYERLGKTPEVIRTLETTIEESRRAGDWKSLANAGSVFLTLTYSSIEHTPAAMALADEIVSLARSHQDLTPNIAIARICQARILYLQYTNAILELRTVLAVQASLPVQGPLVGLVAQYKAAIGYLALADEYARQATDIAFNSGQPRIAIFTVFGLISLHEHMYFHQRYSMEFDAHEVADRVRRAYRVLEQMIDRFGTASDRAIMHSNLANFWTMTKEYESAEQLATGAAKALAGLGDAHGARRAMDIAETARMKAPVARRPTDADIKALSAEDVKQMMQETSSRLIALNGVDAMSSPQREIIQEAWVDFNPAPVLRYCEHLSVTFEPSDLGNLIAMPSLGIKVVRCHFFKKAMKTGRLIHSFGVIKERLGCGTCPHRSPRPEEWQWDWTSV